MAVAVELESMDASVKITVCAFTAEKVTGNIKAINWGNYAAKWTHLKDIHFPDPGPNPIVGMLMEGDYPDLHYSIKDVRKPVARLTPLGWTCVGPPNGLKGGHLQTSLANTSRITRRLR